MTPTEYAVAVILDSTFRVTRVSHATTRTVSQENTSMDVVELILDHAPIVQTDTTLRKQNRINARHVTKDSIPIPLVKARAKHVARARLPPTAVPNAHLVPRDNIKIKLRPMRMPIARLVTKAKPRRTQIPHAVHVATASTKTWNPRQRTVAKHVDRARRR